MGVGASANTPKGGSQGQNGYSATASAGGASIRLSFRQNPHNQGRARPVQKPKPKPPPVAPQQPAPGVEENPLTVQAVDLKIEANCSLHHTQEYDVTEAAEPKLVLRRGDVFQIDVTFDREYNADDDRIKVDLTRCDGPEPAVDVKADHSVRVKNGLKEGRFSGEVKTSEGTKVTLSLLTSPRAIIGYWSLEIRTANAPTGTVPSKWNKHKLPTNIILLFNAWNKDDQVYMAEEDDRDEYVMNDRGRVWRGSASHGERYLRPKDWDFGQFEEGILECCLYLLTGGMLEEKCLADPILVSRLLAAKVNSADDSGVLVGNWSGDYTGGAKPTSWRGSIKILQQYWKTKQPVCYGQCWVFSAVLTTVCRALGIGCRSVTNFGSAHDTDSDCMIERYYDQKGEEIDSLKSDSVWNFHVWNEVWFAREDLGEAKFNGWQALDSTPQETSNGVYTCGPCPVAALKEGRVGVQYDGAFIFAEVNADRVKWYEKIDEDGDVVFKAKKLDNYSKESVGKYLSTKQKRSVGNDREDLTLNYKQPEGSKEEREAVALAQLRCRDTTLCDDDYEDTEEDVQFTLVSLDDMTFGQNMNLTVKLKNTACEEREVGVKIEFFSTYHNTGFKKDKLKSEVFTQTLAPNKEVDVTLRVVAEDYVDWVSDKATFIYQASGHVAQTGAVWNDQYEFELDDAGEVEIEAPNEVKLDEEFEVKLKFKNPILRNLTECVWRLEALGAMEVTDRKHGNIRAGEEATITIPMRFRRPGIRYIQAEFDSKQLADVGGMRGIEVKK